MGGVEPSRGVFLFPVDAPTHSASALDVGVCGRRIWALRGVRVLDALHVLPLLERKHRGRGRGDGAPQLAAGPGVAAGAGRARQAHAPARPGMGPELARIVVPAPTLSAYEALVRALADGRCDCRASAPGRRPEGAASIDGRETPPRAWKASTCPPDSCGVRRTRTIGLGSPCGTIGDMPLRILGSLLFSRWVHSRSGGS